MAAANRSSIVSECTRILDVLADAGQRGVSPQMALRLSKALGRSPERWMATQHDHDLWNARRTTDLSVVSKVTFEAA